MAVKFPYQNQILISGRLTRDPEFRSTQKGTTVCFFDIASNRRYKDASSGEWKDETTFVPVVVWGQLADKCKDKIKKGNPVYVEGRLSNSEYTNKDGVKVKRLRIVANKIQIMEVTKDEREPQNPADLENEEGSDKSAESQDDIPF
ncbi:MAG: single-stranded DNA-binding protein [Elusimicrobiota bacterium]